MDTDNPPPEEPTTVDEATKEPPRLVISDCIDYVVAQATCRLGHTLTGYGETEEEARDDLWEEFGFRRHRCDWRPKCEGCDLIAPFS